MKNMKAEAKRASQLAHFTFERTTDAIFWIDHEASIRQVNEAACQYLGYSRDELLSLTVHDIDPDYPADTWPNFWQKVKKDKAFTIESRHQTKDGHIVPVEISINYVEFDGKEYICAVARDISSREQAEEEIRSLAKFPGENPNPVLRIAKDGTITYANDASSPLLAAWGCQTGQLLPDNWQNLISQIFESAQSKETEVRCGERIFSVLLSPIADGGYVTVYGRDITDRRRAEEEIRSLAKFPSENPNPVLRIAKDGTIIYANDGSSPLLATWGCQPGQLLPDDWQEFTSEVFSSHRTKEIEITCGDQVFLVLFLPIVDAGYLTVYGRDITDRKRAEDALQNALTEVQQLKNRLQDENLYLQDEIKLEHNFEEIIGRSEKLKQVLREVEQVASTDATVLVLGETGTGKELIARAVHNISDRKSRPLVKINCAALPTNLIESELFGHEKGAFTGALTRKIGRFELADGGTIFLDEIGDLPLELQMKLLRVLQEGDFERLGSVSTRHVDVRIIAATNRDLEQSIKSGGFREDLYYRLNVFPIKIPPLRERKEDIPLLVRRFVIKYCSKIGKNIEGIPSKVMDDLQAYHWPGNVRELENIIERAVIVCHGNQLQLSDSLPKDAATIGAARTPLLEKVEKGHIIEVLELTDWRVSGEKGAAKILGLKPTTLEARMKKLGIKRQR